jgi:hypothetical protein
MNHRKNHRKNSAAAVKPTLFDRINPLLDARRNIVAVILSGLAVLFSFLLFDAKINMMGDDADYILYGYDFASRFMFPGYRGPLYPILLSPFIALFGIRIIMIKIVSGALILGALFFMYRTFCGRIPSLILFACLTLLCVNSYLLFYSSAVLSEPLFLFIQSLGMFLFCKYFVDESAGVSIKRQIVRHCVIAVLILCLTLARTVGYAAIGVIAVYFLFGGQWKKALMSVAANIAVSGLFTLLKKALWPASGSSYRLSSFFTKDMYNPDKGMEDFVGIVVRLLENTTNYLSLHVSRFLGLQTEADTPSNFAALLIFLLFMVGGYMVWRKNRTLFFAALHTLGFCAANFIILHARWLQERFIIVFYPLILLVMLAGVYYLLQSRRRLQFLFLIVAGLLFAGSFRTTLNKTEKNLTALQRYLAGDLLYGLTPDWQNYLQVSKQIAAEAPAGVNIAVRKSGASTIYGNRSFHGVYSVPGIPKDTLIVWRPAAGKTACVVDLSKNRYPGLSDFLTFVAQGETEIDGVKSTLAGICEIDSADAALFDALANDSETRFTADFPAYRDGFLKNSNNLLYSPELMLDQLKSQNVRYMILASLRANPNENTGMIINTLQRYLNIMMHKYPDLAVVKYSVGKSEPATLVELRY